MRKGQRGRSRRALLSLLLAVLMISLLTACAGESQPAGETGENGTVLSIWSWDTDFQERFNDYYPGVVSVSEDGTQTMLEDGTVIRWVVVPEGDYQQQLDKALELQQEGSAGQVDLFLVKAGFAGKYTYSDATLDVDALGVANAAEDQYGYTREIVTDGDGKVKGVTWEACPGVIVYRRSIAKKVLMTDDPEDVQEALKDWDNFAETGIQVGQNRMTMLSGYEDLFNVFYCTIDEPYLADGKTLKVNSSIMDWVKTIKDLADEGYTGSNKRNSDAWYADMGGDSDVFAWPLTSEEFELLMKNSAAAPVDKDEDADQTAAAAAGGEEEEKISDAAGDYGIVQGPVYWTRGGSWIMAANGTQYPEIAAEIMTHMTTDETVLRNFALEEGDFVNSKAIIRELIENDEGNDFFDGQQTFEILNEAAEGITMPNTGAYDQQIGNKFKAAFRDYFAGEIELEEAKAAFEKAIRKQYPEIESVVWPD